MRSYPIPALPAAAGRGRDWRRSGQRARACDAFSLRLRGAAGLRQDAHQPPGWPPVIATVPCICINPVAWHGMGRARPGNMSPATRVRPGFL